MEPEKERQSDSSGQSLRSSTATTRPSRKGPDFMRLGMFAIALIVIAGAIFWFTQRDSSSGGGTSNVEFEVIENVNIPAAEYKMVIVETLSKEPQTTFTTEESVSTELSFKPREEALGEQKIRLHLVNKDTGQSAYDNTLPALNVNEPVVISFRPDLAPATYVAILSMVDLVVGEREFVVQ